MELRKLALKKETLTELSTEEMRSIVGASGPSCVVCISNPCSDLVQCLPTDGCPTADC